MNEQKEHEATKKCAVYARLDRLEAHSVEEQIATCRAEIQKRGWILSEYHVFTDAAWYSRVAMDDRPGLKVFSPGIWWIGVECKSVWVVDPEFACASICGVPGATRRTSRRGSFFMSRRRWRVCSGPRWCSTVLFAIVIWMRFIGHAE
jgi:hypothetical protein